MSEGKKGLVKNVLSLGAVQIANYILPLISVPIISRIIGPEKFGLINYAGAFIAYFNIIISYSFDFTATRRLAKDANNKDYRNKVFSEVFFTQCWLFLFSTLIFLCLIYAVPNLNSERNVLMVSYLLCISTLFTQNWLFQAMEELSKVALLNLISKILFTASVLLCIKQESDFLWQPILIGSIQSIIAIFSFFWAYRKFNLKLLAVPFKKIAWLLFEDRIIFFSLILVSLYTYTNTVILGLYQSKDQVGYYTAAQRLIIICQSVLSMPLAQSFYPFIGKAFVESKEKGLRIAQKLIALIIIFIGMSSIVLLVLGPFVIRAFYGEKFENSIPVFLILAIVPLLFTLNNVLGIQMIVNLGMDKAFLKISGGAAVFSILLNLLMIQQWGYIGSALNWLFTELFLVIVMFVFLYRKGLNPLNFAYFKLNALLDYAQPVFNKFLFIVKGKTASYRSK